MSWLFLYIVTANFGTLGEPGNELLDALVVEVPRLWSQPGLHLLLDLPFIFEAFSSQMLLQMKEETKIARCQVRAVRWVAKNFPVERRPKRGGDGCCVRPSIVMQQTHSLAQSSSALVLNCSTKFFERFAISVSVDGRSIWQKNRLGGLLDVPKRRLPWLFWRRSLDEFFWREMIRGDATSWITVLTRVCVQWLTHVWSPVTIESKNSSPSFFYFIV